MSAEIRRAVLLDRDGTLIPDVGYLRDPDRVELLPHAARALAAFARRGYLLVVVSNQSGVGRGWITPREASAVHDRLVAVLAAAGVALDGAHYCPHAPDAGCACRKPKPGLLLDAAREHGIDLHQSIMIGNAATDIEAGRAAGAFTILLRGDDEELAEPRSADAVAADWEGVCEIVLGQTAGRA